MFGIHWHGVFHDKQKSKPKDMDISFVWKYGGLPYDQELRVNVLKQILTGRTFGENWTAIATVSGPVSRWLARLLREH